MSMVSTVVRLLREQLDPREAAVHESPGKAITIDSPSGSTGCSIEIRVRAAADLEVAFHVPSKKGSPFEQVLTGTAEDAEAVAREAAALACDLVAERKVVAWERRWPGGGRKFLVAADLCPSVLKELKWVRSWRGTHDWDAA